MRKFTVLILIFVFLIAPTAIVTAGQNWDEISRTLSEIQQSLGNIQVLLREGALEETENLSLLELVRKSGIPMEIAMLSQSIPDINSSRYDGSVNIKSKVSTSRDSSNAEFTSEYNGQIDVKDRLFSLNLDLSSGSDRNFTEVLFGDSSYGDIEKIDLEVSSLFVNDNLYLRLTKGGKLFDFLDLSSYKDKWIVVRGGGKVGADLNDAADELQGFFQSENRQSAEARSFLEAHIKYPIFEFTKLTDSQIDGRWYTTYRVNLITKNLVDFEEARMRASGQSFTPLSYSDKQEVAKFLNQLTASAVVAFDSNASELKRISTDIVFDANMDDFGGMKEIDPYGELNPDLKRVVVTINTTHKLSNINQKFNLDEPRNATPLEDILSELFSFNDQIYLREEDQYV